MPFRAERNHLMNSPYFLKGRESSLDREGKKNFNTQPVAKVFGQLPQISQIMTKNISRRPFLHSWIFWSKSIPLQIKYKEIYSEFWCLKLVFRKKENNVPTPYSFFFSFLKIKLYVLAFPFRRVLKSPQKSIYSFKSRYLWGKVARI